MIGLVTVSTLVLVGLALAGGFVAGVLVGRRNKNTVEKVVGAVEKNTGL